MAAYTLLSPPQSASGSSENLPSQSRYNRMYQKFGIRLRGPPCKWRRTSAAALDEQTSTVWIRMIDIEKILKAAVRGGASDILLKTQSKVRFRFNGQLISLADGSLINEQQIEHWIGQIIPAHLERPLSDMEDVDFAYQSKQGYRFRVNIFRQKQSFAIILRVVSNHIRTMEELQLPGIMSNFANEKRGLILVTGATGSGKSTTLASIIEKINKTRASHILTIEDPIEFIFQEKMSTINQREIGIDTKSFAYALRSALRQSPDVILVGELRDRETTETALMAAETGHLVLSTLHTMDAVESLTRLLSYFPPHQHDSLRLMISQTLRYIVSQRLIPRADQRGLVPAIEILVANELVREEIQVAKDFRVIRDAIRNGRESYGMQTFDQSLLELINRGIISPETALANASNTRDMQLQLEGFR